MLYLLVFGGKMLMVCRVLKEDARVVFTVFKADLPLLRWLEVGNIGCLFDMVLFVGRWNSFARCVSGYNLAGNRIYFLDDDTFCRGSSPGIFGAYHIYPLRSSLQV
ncbi:hypothetical protein PR202_ga22547 [Eleusine coracana subsp. coracana]|uniref:KIB1-4 beta-propeller domain-containing protein n=1 Tax=Eleusine coracana subsp. coracana TaxID=191504 RepID=A0AAV5D3X0_ELECO|nr:hypothetical protein PR202_ga22547 [Eleusine coracana subsp. coracana]